MSLRKKENTTNRVMHIEDAAVANVQTSQSVMQLTDRGYSIEWQDKDI